MKEEEETGKQKDVPLYVIMGYHPTVNPDRDTHLKILEALQEKIKKGSPLTGKEVLLINYLIQGLIGEIQKQHLSDEAEQKDKWDRGIRPPHEWISGAVI